MKKRLHYVAPNDVSAWLEKKSREEQTTITDLITRSIRFSSLADMEKIEKIADRCSLKAGALLNVTINWFDNLSEKQKMTAIADYYSRLGED